MAFETLDSRYAHPGYWPSSPFPVECGGNRRQKSPRSPGLNLRPGERLAAVSRNTGRWNVMFIWREPDQLYLLSGSPVGARDAYGRVERVDPQTLETLQTTPELACGGHLWCGALVAHADGHLYAVNGNYLHCLTANLRVLAERRLPADRPYNGILVMPDGRLVTKELRLHDAVSRLTVLEPGTLDIVETIDLPEPSMGRFASDLQPDGSELIYVPGRQHVYRYAYADGRLIRDSGWTAAYRSDDGSSGLAWDTTLGDGRVWFHDNGDNPAVRAIHQAHPAGTAALDRTTAIRQSACSAPVTLHSVSMRDPADAVTVQPTGQPHGWVIAPPVYVPQRRIAVGFDTHNGGLCAYRARPDGALDPIWSSPIRNWWQPLVYRDTMELVVDDFRDGMTDDQLVVLDLESGAEKARIETGSPFPNGMFPCPGPDRSLYYVSSPVVARISVAA